MANPAPRNIGLAQSTLDGDISAARNFANGWLKDNDEAESIDALTEVHLEGDNLERILKQLLHAYATTNVPKVRGEGYMKAESKRTYISKIKEQIYAKCPNHDYWKNNDNWKGLYGEFVKAAQRTEQQGGANTGTNKSIPIYKDILQLPLAAISMKELGMSVADMKGIIRGLLSAANSQRELGSKLYQKCLEIVLCKNADGRGGEHYLLRWPNSFWDHRLNSPQFVWMLPKQLDEQIMLFAPEVFSSTAYLVDIYHRFGCYFVMEKGASHKFEDPAKRPFVFPGLHSVKRENVARSLTAVMRKGLSLQYPLMQESHVKLHSSRGLRVASNTELALHPEVTPDQRISIGGWSHHKNGDGYVHESPALIFPGALALAGRKNVTVSTQNVPHPPTFLWLGESAMPSVKKFLIELCEVDVPQLEEGGQMRPFFLASMASLVMYYPCMKQDFGPTDRVCARLEAVAIQANISDPSLPPGISPREVLNQWSLTLQKKFQEKNADQPGVSDSVMDHLKYVSGQLDTLTTKIEISVATSEACKVSVEDLQRRDIEKSALLESYASRLEASDASNKKLLDTLVSLVESLDDKQLSPRKRKAMQEAILESQQQSPASSSNKTQKMDQGISEIVQNDNSATTTQPDVVDVDAIAAPSLANRLWDECLFDNFKKGIFSNKENPLALKDLPCPQAIKRERSKFKHGLELLVLCFDSKDWKIISGDYKSEEAVKKAEEIIHTACNNTAREYMLRFEKDAHMKDDCKEDKAGTKAKMTITGLGERYRKWKANVGVPRAEEIYDLKLKESGFKSIKIRKQQKVSDIFQLKAPKNAAPKKVNPYKKTNSKKNK